MSWRLWVTRAGVPLVVGVGVLTWWLVPADGTSVTVVRLVAGAAVVIAVLAGARRSRWPGGS